LLIESSLRLALISFFVNLTLAVLPNYYVKVADTKMTFIFEFLTYGLNLRPIDGRKELIIF